MSYSQEYGFQTHTKDGPARMPYISHVRQDDVVNFLPALDLRHTKLKPTSCQPETCFLQTCNLLRTNPTPAHFGPVVGLQKP